MNQEKKICSTCKTGMKLYLLDKRSPMCDYLGCYKGESCPMYVPVENINKTSYILSIEINGKM